MIIMHPIQMLAKGNIGDIRMDPRIAKLFAIEDIYEMLKSVGGVKTKIIHRVTPRLTLFVDTYSDKMKHAPLGTIDNNNQWIMSYGNHIDIIKTSYNMEHNNQIMILGFTDGVLNSFVVWIIEDKAILSDNKNNKFCYFSSNRGIFTDRLKAEYWTYRTLLLSFVSMAVTPVTMTTEKARWKTMPQIENVYVHDIPQEIVDIAKGAKRIKFEFARIKEKDNYTYGYQVKAYQSKKKLF